MMVEGVSRECDRCCVWCRGSPTSAASEEGRAGRRRLIVRGSSILVPICPAAQLAAHVNIATSPWRSLFGKAAAGCHAAARPPRRAAQRIQATGPRGDEPNLPCSVLAKAVSRQEADHLTLTHS